MNLIQYRGFPSLRDMQEEINRVFNEKIIGADDKSVVETSEWSPRVDIIEKKNHYSILVDIPGVDPKDIKITMNDGILTIEGERKLEKKEEQENFYRYERSYGSFARRFALPDNANADKISAKGKNGVLDISIPKSEKPPAKEITIEVDK